MGEKICAKKCINHNLSGTNMKERKGPSYKYQTVVYLGSSKNKQKYFYFSFDNHNLIKVGGCLLTLNY